jgi:hypothetical protein
LLSIKARRLPPAFAPLGFVALHEGRYDAAASSFARAAPGRPHFLYCQAVALALAGRMEEAGAIAKRAMEERPGLPLHAFSQIGTISEIADKVAAGWRLLGLPE